MYPTGKYYYQWRAVATPGGALDGLALLFACGLLCAFRQVYPRWFRCKSLVYWCIHV